MAWFRVDLCGRNFQLELSQPTDRFRIGTEIILAADSAHDAETAAITQLKNHPDLTGRTHNPRTDPPVLYAQATGLNVAPAAFGNFSPLRVEKEPELTAALDLETLFDDEDSD